MSSTAYPSTTRYIAKVELPVSIGDAFAYHERPGALNRLVPPWESVVPEYSDNSLDVGSKVILTTRVLGIPLRWVAEHTHYDPPRLFADRQVSGPFAYWRHEHQFEEEESSRSSLTDQVDYRLPLGALGRIFGSGKARRTIEAMFAFRHRITHDDLALSAASPAAPMQVAVSGRTGLVGSSLSSMLTLFGHQVVPLVRGDSPSEGAIAPWAEDSHPDDFSDVDAVVHLAGKSIAEQRWTDQVKQEIRDSRVIKTRQLCEHLANAKSKPHTLICASASGYYGDRGDELLDEDSSVGEGFLESVAEEWEQACQPAVDAGIRVVHARFGIILSPSGGALQKSLLPAKFFGGKLGSGRQWWSWIGLEDAVGAIYHALTNDTVIGPMNVVSPSPVQNREFASVLGQVIRRTAIIPAPSFGLRAALGEMADALLLSSTRVQPLRLIESGYQFRFTDLREYLTYCLGRERLESL